MNIKNFIPCLFTSVVLYYQIVKELWTTSFTQLTVFFTDDVYYTDINSLFIENKQWDKLDKAGLVGKSLLERKNDYKDCGIFYGLFLAPK